MIVSGCIQWAPVLNPKPTHRSDPARQILLPGDMLASDANEKQKALSNTSLGLLKHHGHL